jgi:hypothetical protein
MAPILSRFSNIGGGNGGFGFGRKKSSSVRGRQIVFTMWGAGGGGWIRKSGPAWGPPSASGGTGGALVATTTLTSLGLTSGSQLYIYVGGGGAMGPGAGGPNGGHPGGGGSGNGGYGGGGGGMSAVYMQGSFSTGTLLLIAGGGSGGFGISVTSGLNAEPPGPSSTQAGGGSQSSGGGGGNGTSGGSPGSPGTQFTGGNAGTHAGGGGAGYYGGGGGGGDGGAATGNSGGAGSCYINTNYFSEDTTDSGISNGVVIANIFRRFPAPFNPVMPFSGPPTASFPYSPLVSPGPYSQPAGDTASLPFPGQNAGHPLYNANYGGGTTSGGGGYPGSVHITIDGVTYSYTTVGPHILNIP